MGNNQPCESERNTVYLVILASLILGSRKYNVLYRDRNQNHSQLGWWGRGWAVEVCENLGARVDTLLFPLKVAVSWAFSHDDTISGYTLNTSAQSLVCASRELLAFPHLLLKVSWSSSPWSSLSLSGPTLPHSTASRKHLNIVKFLKQSGSLCKCFDRLWMASFFFCFVNTIRIPIFSL